MMEQNRLDFIVIDTVEYTTDNNSDSFYCLLGKS